MKKARVKLNILFCEYERVSSKGKPSDITAKQVTHTLSILLKKC